MRTFSFTIPNTAIRHWDPQPPGTPYNLQFFLLVLVAESPGVIVSTSVFGITKQTLKSLTKQGVQHLAREEEVQIPTVFCCPKSKDPSSSFIAAPRSHGASRTHVPNLVSRLLPPPSRNDLLLAWATPPRTPTPIALVYDKQVSGRRPSSGMPSPDPRLFIC